MKMDDSADRTTAFFFGIPFGVAGRRIVRLVKVTHRADRFGSLANEEEQIGRFVIGGKDWDALGLGWRSGDEGFRCICWGCVHAFVYIDSDGELHTSMAAFF